MPERGRRIEAFLAAAGWAESRRQPLAGDASFRRYQRLTRDGSRAVLMDAPPPRDNVEAFARIARALLDLGLSAPRPIRVDVAAGLLLLEDLGDRTFNRELAGGAEEGRLYRLAIDALIALHRRWPPEQGARPALPYYDDASLIREAALLPEWTLPAVRGLPAPSAAPESYAAAWRAVLPRARRVPDTLVLRDYHVDNLVLLEGRPGESACGLLDFQDAVIGPAAYDVVSLLEDARRDVAPAIVAEITARYLNAFPGLDRAAFQDSYTILGAQRAAKIIGIFTRLWRRDGKPQYLRHIPRVWRLLEAGLARPVLAPVRAWFDREVPAGERAVPPRNGAA